MVNLNSSTYYYKPKRSRLERAKEELDIKAAIKKIREDLPQSGYRTLQRYLKREHGIKIGETKLRRIIRENLLQAKQISGLMVDVCIEKGLPRNQATVVRKRCSPQAQRPTQRAELLLRLSLSISPLSPLNSLASPELFGLTDEDHDSSGPLA